MTKFFPDVAKLLDFGLVRPVATTVDTDLSAEGQIVGTPLFMSPEQAVGGRELEERSDIYALGAVAYYLLTGQPPFNGTVGLAVLAARARDPVVPPSQLLAGIRQHVERVVLQCLAKESVSRYVDTQSLNQAQGACACSADWDQAHAVRWWQENAHSADVAVRVEACTRYPSVHGDMTVLARRPTDRKCGMPG